VDTEDLQLRLDFLGFTDEDREALAALRPLVEKNADEFVGAFYRHLLSFEGTRSLLSDPEVKEKLLQKQREYLLSLTAPDLTGRYVAERMRIGDTHERVRLEPRWYLGSYALYSSLLLPLICEHYKADPVRAERTISSLYKILMLDAQLAMEAYIGRRERQLEYLTRELAAQSRDLERSYEEQGSELRQTTERARAAEQLASIGTLVAGLAHEIGTPMGVIQGHAEMLESSVSDERGQWRLETIREQIDRISGIIQTLLNIARPQAPERASVELVETIQGCLDFLGERLKRNNVEVETDFAVHAKLEGDRQKLQQVFLNLFLNAVDAMPDGGTLSVRVDAEEEQHAEVRIGDSGAGMPQAVLDRVFEPFFSTKPAGRGSGLGLMVVQGIIQEHGGQITAESAEGQGTEFRIVLPAETRPPDPTVPFRRVVS
jgi:signal transduction histidine kinase